MKKYEVEFVSIVAEKYTCEIEVPDHVGDDRLQTYLQDVVDELGGKDLTLQHQDPLSSYITRAERQQGS